MGGDRGPRSLAHLSPPTQACPGPPACPESEFPSDFDSNFRLKGSRAPLLDCFFLCVGTSVSER